MSKTNDIFLRENLIRSLERRQSLLTTIRWETKQKVEKIIIKESFYKFLSKVDKMKVSDEERSKIYDFIFCLLNRSADLKTNKKPSSANITSMYWGNSYSRLSKIKSKKEIIDLIKFLHKEDIPFSSISSMQSWEGIPKIDELKMFIEFLKKEKLLEYLYSISWMQHWKGIPNLDELKMFIEFLKNEKLLEYLSSISWMQTWRWIPNLDRLKELINFARNNQIPFSFVSSMQVWKGIPDLKILWELITEAREKELNLKELSGKQLWVEATLKLVKTAYEQKRELD